MKDIKAYIVETLFDDDEQMAGLDTAHLSSFDFIVRAIAKEFQICLENASKESELQGFNIDPQRDFEQVENKLRDSIKTLSKNKNIGNPLNGIIITYRSQPYTGERNPDLDSDKKILTAFATKHFTFPKKISTEWGNINLAYSDHYIGSSSKELYVIIRFNYSPNAKAKALKPKVEMVDMFGTPISKGDWIVGTQSGAREPLYGIVKSIGDLKVTIERGSWKSYCMPKHCVIINHEGKPVDFTNVKKPQ